MYAVYANDTCIWSGAYALDNMRLINPKLTLEDSAAGSLTMTLPPDNVGFSLIRRLTTDISVRRDGAVIWAGRVLRERRDFWNCRALTCEGELAFFNDTTQPQAEHKGLTVRGYLDALLAVHNAKVPENRRFQLGAVSVYDDEFPTRYTNYEKTMELLNALVKKHGGHLRVRHEDGTRYLDYLQEWADTCPQLIEFGSNLIDFTRDWDSSQFATVIIPLGKRLDKSPIKDLEARLTVESVNGGSACLQSEEAVAAFGWIEKTVSFDDEDDPEKLLEKGRKYLSELQFDGMELTVSALDLSYLNVDAQAVKLLDQVRVISRPHGLDKLFPVKKLDIPLDSPEKTKFSLGDTVRTSLTGTNNQISAGIMNKIDGLPKAHNILEEAKKNATAIINLATRGYITITRDENGSDTLYISSERDYTKSEKLWRWNINGLGYSKDGGKTFGLAMTMDGAIVADFITAGVMNANVIRIGVLKDYGENTVFDLNNGTLTMKKGSISLGQYFDKDGRANYHFSVDNDGNLIARRGTFAGTLEAAKGTFGGQLVAVTGDFKGVVQAEDFLDRKGNSMLNNGKFKGDYLDLMGIHVVNNKGVTVMTIDQGGIRFGPGCSPIKYKYAASASGPWYDAMFSGAKYRKESVDGGESWGTAYQFVGTDGDDANVPSYITATKITQTTIESPTIVGGTIRGGKFVADFGGGLRFVTANGNTQWGAITYDKIQDGDGIVIGSLEHILLNPALGSVFLKDEYGVSQAASREWVTRQSGNRTAVFA